MPYSKCPDVPLIRDFSAPLPLYWVDAALYGGLRRHDIYDSTHVSIPKISERVSVKNEVFLHIRDHPGEVESDIT
jgi:hypothetical protein